MNRRSADHDARQAWGTSIRLILLLSILAPLLPACRVPDPPVIKDKRVGIVYDTAMEEEVRSGKSALLQTAFANYVDTLAEPVAITAWSTDVCRWEVFVATNRGRFAPSSDRNAADNLALDVVSYGRSDVLLPRQVRGKDPKMSPGRKPLGIVPGFGKRNEKQDLIARAETEQLSEEEFLDGVNSQLSRSRQQDLLLFVHGFNVSFDSAVIRTAQVALDMPFNGAVVSYCWPSQGGVFSYNDDEPINKASVAPFTQFLTTLRAGVPPETRISIVVHSMGNRIVMESLSRMAGDSWDGAKPFANVALCAPDVGQTEFQKWAPGVVAVSDRVSLYSSSGDAALIASKGLHRERRAGDAWEPLIVEGVETIDCSRIDLTFMGHSYYGSNTDVLSDLFMLIKEVKPAAKRPHLSRLKSDDGQTFYQFSKSAPEFRAGWHFDELEESAMR